MSVDPTLLGLFVGSLLGPFLIIRVWSVFRSLVGS